MTLICVLGLGFNRYKPNGSADDYWSKPDIGNLSAICFISAISDRIMGDLIGYYPLKWL